MERSEKQQTFEKEGDARDVHLELFQELKWRCGISCKFIGFNPGEDGKEGKVEISIVRVAQADVWVTTVVRTLTEQRTHEGEQKKLYAEKKGNTLELAMSQLTWNVKVEEGVERHKIVEG